MRLALKIVSVLSLIALILPSILFLAGRMDLDKVKWYMLIATIVWFVTATPIMWKDNGQQDNA
jgi:branched-subunit amino acid transport protein